MTVLQVGRQPEEWRAEASFLDGTSGRAHAVSLWIEDGCLVSMRFRWPLDQIRVVPDQAGGDLIVLNTIADPLARLMLRDPLILPRLPNAHLRPRTAPRGRLAMLALAAMASVAVIIFGLVPLMANQLAAYIPPKGAHALGQATLTQIRDTLDDTSVSPIAFCTQADGRTALDQLTSRFRAAGGLDIALDVHVLDHPMVNAFALPGGQVVLFRGLIEAAETPEQVAAVLAHEIGHVVSRDPTRNALRSAGSIGVLGLVFGDFAGGALVLFLTERLIDAQYSQTAEAEADIFAHRLMRQANMAPDALAHMFETFRDMGGDTGGIVAHFMAHPQLGDRIQAARAATPDGFTGTAAMTAAQWQAFQDICTKTGT